MGEASKIEWTDHTFNPWIGCTKVSDGCTNCYAETLMDKRYGRVSWGKGNPRSRTSPANWRKMLRWDQDAMAEGRQRSVFCASLADIFDNEVPSSWRDDFWNLIAGTPHLLKLVLTKRPENFKKMIPKSVWDKPFGHVAFGVSAEDQDAADKRIPILLETPAAMRFVSAEPLLGPINFQEIRLPAKFKRGVSEVHINALTAQDDEHIYNDHAALDWIIVGGESGTRARLMDPDWARSIRDQCSEQGVKFFMKQMTKRAPIPDDLMIREFCEP